MQIERMQKMYDVPARYREGKEGIMGDQMIDMSKYAKIGAVIDVLGTYAVGANYKENKQLHEFFKSTIQSLPLDDFKLLDISLQVEPPQ